MSEGYPIDERSDDFREAAADSLFADFELTAAQILARHSGERVVLQDTGEHNAMVDIRIERTSGADGYCEVTIDCPPKEGSTANEIRNRRFRLSSDGLKQNWCLWIRRDCRLSNLNREAPKLLAALEDASWPPLGQRVDTADLASADHSSAHELLRLKVAALHSHAAGLSADPEVQVVQEPIGGPIASSDGPLLAALSAILTSPQLSDVRHKLAATDSPERHLFLGTTLSTPWGITSWLLRAEQRLPTHSPELREEITHLWLSGAESPLRTIAWSPHDGWFDLTLSWKTK